MHFFILSVNLSLLHVKIPIFMYVSLKSPYLNVHDGPGKKRKKKTSLRYEAEELTYPEVFPLSRAFSVPPQVPGIWFVLHIVR